MLSLFKYLIEVIYQKLASFQIKRFLYKIIAKL